MSNLSWLNPTPHATAVYASCSALLPPHATLASRWPATTLPGLDFHQLIAPALAGAFVAVGTRVSPRAPRPDPYVQLSRIRLLPRVCDGTSCRIRSSAFDTRVWLRVQYVLCWTIFPLALALRSTDSAATALPVGFPRFVRRLPRYYDRARLPASVHHRLRLLAFPMRTVPLPRNLTARRGISQLPTRSVCT